MVALLFLLPCLAAASPALPLPVDGGVTCPDALLVNGSKGVIIVVPNRGLCFFGCCLLLLSEVSSGVWSVHACMCAHVCVQVPQS
jgi:hypothetical protein